MKNVLKHSGKRQGITMVQRLSILDENRSQRTRHVSRCALLSARFVIAVSAGR